jgi:hypothetical protein
MASLSGAHAVILAVPHRFYLEGEGAEQKVMSLLSSTGVVIDVKSVLDREILKRAGIPYWRL